MVIFCKNIFHDLQKHFINAALKLQGSVWSAFRSSWPTDAKLHPVIAWILVQIMNIVNANHLLQPSALD